MTDTAASNNSLKKPLLPSKQPSQRYTQTSSISENFTCHTEEAIVQLELQSQQPRKPIKEEAIVQLELQTHNQNGNSLIFSQQSRQFKVQRRDETHKIEHENEQESPPSIGFQQWQDETDDPSTIR